MKSTNHTNNNYKPKQLKLPLDIDGNKNITGIENLTYLQYLSMNDCGLTDLSFMKNLTELKNVSIDDNNITNADAIKKLLNIKELFMQNCNLNDISFLENSVNLTRLNVNNNNIFNINVLGNLPRLELLYMNKNKIADISVLGNLKGLLILEMQENLIEDLTPLTENLNEKIVLPQYMQVALQQDISTSSLIVYNTYENGNVDYSSGRYENILKNNDGQFYIPKEIFNNEGTQIANLEAIGDNNRYNMTCKIEYIQSNEIYTTIPTKQIDGKECITTLNGQNNKVGDVLDEGNDRIRSNDLNELYKILSR